VAAKRVSADQGALFEVPAKAKPVKTLPEPMKWPNGVKPWDPIDQADTEVGWQHTWVTPRRAVEIRQEIDHG
jgi:hypothetical protein